MNGVRFKAVLMASLTAALLALGGASSAAHATCQLKSASGAIKHLVYIEFDNVHFTRDNPNVPSDLEQMPNLLNFIKNNGTLDTGDHAILISHTANNILTTQTGVYSDRDGIAVANSFGVFGPVDAVKAPNGVWFPSSFFYWTDLVSDITPGTNDPLYAMLTETGQNMPAPWAPFTRAGCDVGAFSTANIVLERTPFDVVKVFGANSPQAADPLQTTNYIGEAVHCALGSTVCTEANGAVADLLPDEPGGYTNFKALFGGKYLNTAFGALKDLEGNVIADSKSNPGFPGFNPTATQTLGAVATMLEDQIPVVFAYISDLHDNRSGPGTFGPGQAGFVAQAAQYNAAFGKFFDELKRHGIDQTNTLFVFTPDEGDHFAGSAPTPASCDGINTPCTYATIGELNINLAAVAANAGNTTPFDLHFDDAPTIYVAGEPGPTNPAVRQLERTMAGLTAVDQYAGNQSVNLMAAMADQIEERMLHMVAPADSMRTPTFTFFGHDDFFYTSTGSATPIPGPNFAWNHGDFQPEIARTFIGIVGPGVANLGILGPGSVKHKTDSFFSDHVDVRPTFMELVGLKDDYVHDGRVITEVLTDKVMPKSLKANNALIEQLGQIYKHINAPFGRIGTASLVFSTNALKTGSGTDDHVYLAAANRIQDWIDERDSIATRIKSMLNAAEFGDQKINPSEAKALIKSAKNLISEVESAKP